MKPKDIQYVLFEPQVNQKWRIFGGICESLGGRLLFFDKDEKNRSLEQRFKLGMPWDQTEIFLGRYKLRLDEGEQVRGANTLNELVKHYGKFDTLHNSIRDNGYMKPGLFTSKSQSGDSAIPVFVTKSGEIAVGADGNHRIAIAKLLKLKQVPVRVLCWEGSSFKDFQNYNPRSIFLA